MQLVCLVSYGRCPLGWWLQVNAPGLRLMILGRISSGFMFLIVCFIVSSALLGRLLTCPVSNRLCVFLGSQLAKIGKLDFRTKHFLKKFAQNLNKNSGVSPFVCRRCLQCASGESVRHLLRTVTHCASEQPLVLRVWV